eukprot:CAMPEP_0168556050 /NCGR_PEP_ID=MMETSP0413-20121227/8671_1 /TAXON_ID=136452 /ORGANISM="Filamoeba nolandi, Strain NC-AS-23-1" /LENGTH=794 /DNA_ID=CAMNT_0008586961 /DNA_START=168 /DNA_END=2549 /DNA_ORIENTATION=+
MNAIGITIVVLCWHTSVILSQLDNCYGGSINTTVYFGGSGTDFALSGIITSQEVIYVAGYTGSPYSNFPNNTQWTDLLPFGTNYAVDAWVAKTTVSETIPSNILLFGGLGNDYLFGIDVDENSQRLCSTGYSGSNGFPIRNSSRNTTAGLDVFLTVFNSAGSISNQTAILSMLFGGQSEDVGIVVHCESELAYVTGYTYSSNFTTQDPTQYSAHPFVSIINITSGSILSNNFYGNTCNTNWHFASTYYEVGQTKRLALCGFTEELPSACFPVSPNAHQSNISGIYDAWIMILNVTSPTNVQIEYLSYYGGSAYEECWGITADDEGYVYIHGRTESSDLEIVNGLSVYRGGGGDSYFAVFHPNGSLVYSTYYGGDGVDTGRKIQVLNRLDGLYQVYIAGTTNSTNLPILANFQFNGDANDVFLAAFKLSPERSNGSLTFGTYISGVGSETVESLYVRSDGRIMMSGGSNGNLPGSSHVPSGVDAYYMIIDCPALVPQPSVTPTPSPEADHQGSGDTSSHTIRYLIGGGLGGGIVVTIIATIVIFFLYKRYKRIKLEKNDLEMNHYEENALAPDRNSAKKNDKTSSQEEAIAKAMIDQKWEIPYEDIKIKSEIGRGAFGTVYKGRWRNCDCVVKQLSIDRADERAVQDFLKETETTKRLRNHPNVCTILGVCTAPEHPICIVMEFVSGGNLQKHIFSKSLELNKNLIISMGCDITSGMSHLHHENILHCDLACRNLLVDRKGTNDFLVKITDFGLAHTVNTDSDIYDASSASVVPIRWSAPEVLTQLQMSKASDVW